MQRLVDRVSVERWPSATRRSLRRPRRNPENGASPQVVRVVAHHTSVGIEDTTPEVDVTVEPFGEQDQRVSLHNGVVLAGERWRRTRRRRDYDAGRRGWAGWRRRRHWGGSLLTAATGRDREVEYDDEARQHASGGRQHVEPTLTRLLLAFQPPVRAQSSFGSSGLARMRECLALRIIATHGRGASVLRAPLRSHAGT